MLCPVVASVPQTKALFRAWACAWGGGDFCADGKAAFAGKLEMGLGCRAEVRGFGRFPARTYAAAPECRPVSRGLFGSLLKDTHACLHEAHSWAFRAFCPQLFQQAVTVGLRSCRGLLLLLGCRKSKTACFRSRWMLLSQGHPFF